MPDGLLMHRSAVGVASVWARLVQEIVALDRLLDHPVGVVRRARAHEAQVDRRTVGEGGSFIVARDKTQRLVTHVPDLNIFRSPLQPFSRVHNSALLTWSDL